MMKLGFVSAILPELSFEEVIDFAAEHGFAYVEIMCWPVGKADRRYAGVTHIDVSSLNEAKAEEINAYLAKKGVQISALGYYPNPMHADEEKSHFFLSHLAKVIRGAHLLGLSQVNTFVGRDQAKNLEDNFEKFRQVWPPIIQYAEDNGVNIGIENCPMYFTYDEWPEGQNIAYSPAIWRRMFEMINSTNFGLNYDPSHLLWMQMNYIRPIYEFKDRISHVHIKDARVYRDKLDDVGILATPLSFHSPKLPGLGDVDWGAYFSALNDIGYEGPVCIEVEDKAYEGSLETRKLALIQSRDYLRQFVVH